VKQRLSRSGKILAFTLALCASDASAQDIGNTRSQQSLPTVGQVLPDSDLPPLPALPSGFADNEISSFTEGLASSYSLDSLLKLAAANNPTIRQARLQIGGETSKALQAGLYPNPLLMYVGEKINSDGRAGEFQGFEVQQRFVTANKLQLSRLKYRQRAHVAEHLAIAQQYRVSNDIQRHFYQTLAAMDRIILRRELLKTAEDASITSRELYNQGQTNLPGIRRANVELQQRRLDLLDAENEYAEAFRQLTSVIGCTLPIGRVDGTLRPTEVMPPFETLYTGLIEESPEVLAARAKLCADQTTVQRESVQWVPDIVVQGGPGYNFSNNEPVYNASVQLELPLHDRNQGTILQARRDLQRQQEEIRRVELHLRERLAMAYRAYVTALQHATEYERVIIPERKNAYRELLDSYKANRVDWPAVLDAQRDFFAARLQQINQFRDVRLQETLINGFLLEDGLMAAQGPTPPGHIDAVPKPR
jgi:outer membrane protein TolC